MIDIDRYPTVGFQYYSRIFMIFGNINIVLSIENVRFAVAARMYNGYKYGEQHYKRFYVHISCIILRGVLLYIFDTHGFR